MGLSNEAAYLYFYAKKLSGTDKKLRRLSKKAEKHKTKHIKASSEEKKNKHAKKHSSAKEEILKLMKKHNKLVAKIKHHHIAFSHSLHKQHKL